MPSKINLAKKNSVALMTDKYVATNLQVVTLKSYPVFA